MLFTPRRGSRSAPWLLMNKLSLFLATGLIACGGTGSTALDGGSDLRTVRPARRTMPAARRCTAGTPPGTCAPA